MEGLEWLPAAGNASVLLCFCLCLWLNANITQARQNPHCHRCISKR